MIEGPGPESFERVPRLPDLLLRDQVLYEVVRVLTYTFFVAVLYTAAGGDRGSITIPEVVSRGVLNCLDQIRDSRQSEVPSVYEQNGPQMRAPNITTVWINQTGRSPHGRRKNRAGNTTSSAPSSRRAIRRKHAFE